MKTNQGLAAIVRAALNSRKCIEARGDAPEAVEFTYPTTYVEGNEFSCSLTVDPERGTTVVLFKLDKLVEEFSQGHGSSRAEKIANLLASVERFGAFCARCDEDQELTRFLTSRGFLGLPVSSKNALDLRTQN